jgi:hypothetical protein
MDTERRLVPLPDGREIDLLLAGPAEGLPLVMHEGTPHGLVLYPPTVQAVRRRSARAGLRRPASWTVPCGRLDRRGGAV